MNTRKLWLSSAPLWFCSWLACNAEPVAAPEAPVASPREPPVAAPAPPEDPTAPEAPAATPLPAPEAPNSVAPKQPPARRPKSPAPDPQIETAKPLTQKPHPPAPAVPPAPAPAPAPLAPVSPPKPATRVVVPQTDHVRVDVPRGLQALLDADPRMQPWLAKVLPVIDKCYAAERKRVPGAEGVVQIAVTMHPNARPDADIKSVPAQLGGVVACATPDLMRARPPLFTGPEGETHTVKIRFQP